MKRRLIAKFTFGQVLVYSSRDRTHWQIIILWTPLPHTLTLLLVSKCNAHLVLWHPFVRTSCKEVPRCWWSWSGGASLPLAFSPLSHNPPPTANRFPVCQKNFSPLFQTSPPSLRESEACHVLGMFSMGTFIQPSKPPKAWFSSKYISRRELLQCSAQELCIGCFNPAYRLPLTTGGELTQPRSHSFADPCALSDITFTYR